MTVELDKLAHEGQITEMFIRGLIGTGLQVGYHIEHPRSLAELDGIVTALATAVLAGMAVPASSPLAMPQPVLSDCPAKAAGEPDRCMAHGQERCYWCSLNPSGCATSDGPCGVYAEGGMHWDTCPNRVRGPDGQCPMTMRVTGSFKGSASNPLMRCIRLIGHDGTCAVFSAQRYEQGFNDPWLGRA